MMKVFKKDHCQLTYKPGSQDAITTKNEMIYNLLYLYVLRLKIRLDRHLFLRVRCLVVSVLHHPTFLLFLKSFIKKTIIIIIAEKFNG